MFQCDYSSTYLCGDGVCTRRRLRESRDALCSCCLTKRREKEEGGKKPRRYQLRDVKTSDELRENEERGTSCELVWRVPESYKETLSRVEEMQRGILGVCMLKKTWGLDSFPFIEKAKEEIHSMEEEEEKKKKFSIILLSLIHILFLLFLSFKKKRNLTSTWKPTKFYSDYLQDLQEVSPENHFYFCFPIVHPVVSHSNQISFHNLFF